MQNDEFDFELSEEPVAKKIDDSDMSHHHHHHSHHSHHSTESSDTKRIKSTNKKKSIRWNSLGKMVPRKTVRRFSFKSIANGLSQRYAMPDNKKNKLKNRIKYTKKNYNELSYEQKRKIIVKYTLIALAIIAAVVLLTVYLCHKHSWSKWELHNTPTCSTPGIYTSSCYCGKTRTKTVEIEHKFEYLKLDADNGCSVYKCSVCGYEEIKAPEADKLGIDVIIFDNDLYGITETESEFTFDSDTDTFSGKAVLCADNSKNKPDIQLSLKNKVTFVSDWGAYDSYILKSCCYDSSMLRNIISSNLYGNAVKSHTDIVYSKLVNGGASDGIPVIVYCKNEFFGLYTLNLPVDNNLYNMNGKGKQAILSAEKRSDYTYLYKTLEYEVEFCGYKFDYCSTENTDWAVDSFNKMIDFINDKNDGDFAEGIGKYIDVDVAIDTLIATYVLNAKDCCGSDIVWTTYDGVKWAPTMTNLQMTFGLYKNGNEFTSVADFYPGSDARINVLYQKLLSCLGDKVRMRYETLKSGAFSVENIKNTVELYETKIPELATILDENKWGSVGDRSKNTASQMIDFINEHYRYLDLSF